jgi:hypothetical protein
MPHGKKVRRVAEICKHLGIFDFILVIYDGVRWKKQSIFPESKESSGQTMDCEMNQSATTPEIVR